MARNHPAFSPTCAAVLLGALRAAQGEALSCRLLLGGLVVVQVVNGALRVGRRREDRPLVLSQDLEPRGDIGGMVLACLRRDAEISAEKRRADFGHEFLHGIARIAEALAVEVPMETGGMTRPMRHLMGGSLVFSGV